MLQRKEMVSLEAEVSGFDSYVCTIHEHKVDNLHTKFSVKDGAGLRYLVSMCVHQSKQDIKFVLTHCRR